MEIGDGKGGSVIWYLFAQLMVENDRHDFDFLPGGGQLFPPIRPFRILSVLYHIFRPLARLSRPSKGEPPQKGKEGKIPFCGEGLTFARKGSILIKKHTKKLCGGSAEGRPMKTEEFISSLSDISRKNA